MRTFLAIAVLSLVGCAAAPVKRDLYSSSYVHEAPRDDAPEFDTGSGGGFTPLPPLRLMVFGQAETPATGPLSALTVTGALTAGSIQTTGNIIVGTAAAGTVRASGYGISNNASNVIGIGLGGSGIEYRSSSASGLHAFQAASGASTYATIGPGSAGTITLAAGTGNATVTTGMRCVCTDTTAVAAVRCAVSGTTLTATGTGTDVIAYHCL